MTDKTAQIVDYLFTQEKELRAERAALAQSAEPETLAELDAVIADVRNASTGLITQAHQREEKRERARKWREIVPQCRAALDAVEQLNQAHERQMLKVSELRSWADAAFNRIMQMRDKRPKPQTFPTDTELALQAERERKAEAAHKTAVDRVKEANQKEGEIARELLQARETLSRLEFQERQLRPRSEMPPQRVEERGAVGELNAVR